MVACMDLVFCTLICMSEEHQSDQPSEPRAFFRYKLLRWCFWSFAAVVALCLSWAPLNLVSNICFMDPGCSMTTVLLQVSNGKRPCVELIPDQKPRECDQMISIMTQCWDQDQMKRPHFSGAKVKQLIFFFFNLDLKLTVNLQLSCNEFPKKLSWCF